MKVPRCCSMAPSAGPPRSSWRTAVRSAAVGAGQRPQKARQRRWCSSWRRPSRLLARDQSCCSRSCGKTPMALRACPAFVSPGLGTHHSLSPPRQPLRVVAAVLATPPRGRVVRQGSRGGDQRERSLPEARCGVSLVGGERKPHSVRKGGRVFASDDDPQHAASHRLPHTHTHTHIHTYTLVCSFRWTRRQCLGRGAHRALRV